MARGEGPKRKKRSVGTPKHFRKEWRELRANVLREAGGWCQLDHPGCTLEADQVHHRRYNRGRGVKRLLVGKEFLVACCFNCHRIEDPWLGRGFGLGSRERNSRKDRAA